MIRTRDTSENWLRAVALLALVFGFASVARAQSCSMTVPELGFGQYDPVGAHATAPNDTASGSVRVACSPPGLAKKITFAATLNLGMHAIGGQRRLNSGPHYLDYQIYLDGGRNTVFGSASPGVLHCSMDGDRGPCSHSSSGNTLYATFPIFGRMPGGQDAAPGFYTDTLAVTITF